MGRISGSFAAQGTWIQDNDGNDMPIGLLEVAYEAPFLMTVRAPARSQITGGKA